MRPCPLRVVVPSDDPLGTKVYENEREIVAETPISWPSFTHLRLVIEPDEINHAVLETEAWIGEIECDARFADSPPGEAFRVSLKTDGTPYGTEIKRLDGVPLPAALKAEFEVYLGLEGPPLVIHREAIE